VLGLRHPFTHALYEKDEDAAGPTGLVRVTATDGAVGRFHADGRWASGELREADPQLCGWVAGPKLGSRRVRVDPK
jgi:hypothetical protein